MWALLATPGGDGVSIPGKAGNPGFWPLKAAGGVVDAPPKGVSHPPSPSEARRHRIGIINQAHKPMLQCSIGFVTLGPSVQTDPWTRALMTTYRFRWLNAKGDAPESMQIECATDLHAIEVAERQTGDHEVIEVWDGCWLICRVQQPKQDQKG